MANVVTLNGLEALKTALEEPASDSVQQYVIFYANAEGEKVSWCPDCVKG